MIRTYRGVAAIAFGVVVTLTLAAAQAWTAAGDHTASAEEAVKLTETVPWSAPFAVTTTQALRWDLTATPADASGDATLKLTRDDGVVTQRSVDRSSGSLTAKIGAGELQPGYYDVAISFPEAADWTGSVVVMDGTAVQDPRLGIDAQPSLIWNGAGQSAPTAQQARQRAELFKAIGFGSVRDRLPWSALDGACTSDTGPLCANQTAQIFKDNGLDVVTVANAGVPLPRDGEPFDLDVAFTTGQKFAQRFSGRVTAVEFANEPSFPGFFPGYPFQYSSALKAFTAGVKSIDPSLRVLAGSYLDGGATDSSNDPRRGLLFEQEALENNIGPSYDTGNEHRYPALGSIDSLPTTVRANKRAADTRYGVDDRASWLTEIGFNLGLPGQEPVNDSQERLQAAYVTESYAAGFAAGYERVFAFYWETLLESCPQDGSGATTSSCQSVWGLTRNAYSKQFLDGRSQTNSPRPAIASAAAMIRHVAGHDVDQYLTNTKDCPAGEPCGSTVYFDGGLAVTWDSGRTLQSFGPGVTAKNMFGRAVTDLTVRASSQTPYLLSGVTEAAGAVDVTVPQSAAAGGTEFRVEAGGLKVNGKELPQRKAMEIAKGIWAYESAVLVKKNDVITLVARARAGADNRDVAGSTKFTCEGGEGLVVDQAASGPQEDGYLCQFTVGSTRAPSQSLKNGAFQWQVDSYVKVTGRNGSGGQEDWVRAAVGPAVVPTAVLEGKPYVGQTMTVREVAGAKEYVWIYRTKPGTPVSQHGVGRNYEVTLDDIDGEGSYPVEVRALDAQGDVLAAAWFRPTRFQVQGWAEPAQITAEPGKLHINAAWAFDWADVTGPGRMVATVGAVCEDATADQKYGFDAPFVANQVRTGVLGVYTLVNGGTYWFMDYTIDGIRQRGEQDVYLYVVPSNWDGSCSQIHRPNNLVSTLKRNFGDAPTPVLDAAGSSFAVSQDPVVADGVTAGEVTVTLVDAEGRPYVGEVALASAGASGSGVTVGGFTAQIEGVYTASFTGTVIGDWPLTVTAGGASVPAAPGSGIAHLVKGGPAFGVGLTRLEGPSASGQAEDVNGLVVTAHVVDAAGRPLDGVNVTFAIPAGLSAGSSAGPATVLASSDGDGVAQLTVTARLAGTYDVTATVGGSAVVDGSPAQLVFDLPPRIEPSEFYMGVMTHPSPRAFWDTADQLSLATGLFGANSIRAELPWSFVADKDGVLGGSAGGTPGGVGDTQWELDGRTALWDTVNGDAGVLQILDYGHEAWIEGLPDTDYERAKFKEYVEYVLDAYSGPRAGVELWNEWNGLFGYEYSAEEKAELASRTPALTAYPWDEPCPSDPGQGYGCPQYYAELAAEVGPVVHEKLPGVPFIVGGVSGTGLEFTWETLRQMKELGVPVDGVSMHPYAYIGSINGGQNRPRDIDQAVEYFADEVEKAYGERLPIYISEVGWSTCDDSAQASCLPEDTVASYLVDTYVRLRALPDVQGVWWYDLRDNGNNANDPEHRFGLLSRDGGLKSSAVAFATLSNFWGDCESVSPRQGTWDTDSISYTLTCPDGERQIVTNAPDGFAVPAGSEALNLVTGEVAGPGALPAAWGVAPHVGLMAALAPPEAPVLDGVGSVLGVVGGVGDWVVGCGGRGLRVELADVAGGPFLGEVGVVFGYRLSGVEEWSWVE
ncbi:MAG: Ig-like domain-containing protein, partial [Bifidobacteriaceae bacterium]|nr:Ig-like domain-containing protein [Bifidobacteriaceae bacterium]